MVVLTAPQNNPLHISLFPPEERAAMVGDDGFIRVDCAFCATDFPIALEDVAQG